MWTYKFICKQQISAAEHQELSASTASDWNDRLQCQCADTAGISG